MNIVDNVNRIISGIIFTNMQSEIKETTYLCNSKSMRVQTDLQDAH